MTGSEEKDKIRVLILAELANPEWVSVPLVGWNHAYALSQKCEVHLVTHARNRQGIERSGTLKGPVTYISLGPFDKLLDVLAYKILKLKPNGVSYTGIKYPFYCLFEFLVWWHFHRHFQQKAFDVVHRLTPVSPALPSPLARILGFYRIPFILGPINGGLSWPRGYGMAAKKEAEWLTWVRGFYRHLPFIKSTRSKAAAILLGSKNLYQEIPQSLHQKCEHCLENGVYTNDLFTGEKTPGERLKVLFVGRLVAGKCPDLVLVAGAPLVRQGLIELHFVGDGPERSGLEALARYEGITDQVTFHGWLAHKDTLKVMETCDVFAFPSIREFGGAVVMEAMAKQMVPIVMDYGGPAEIVDEESGFRLPLTSAEQTVADMRQTFTRLLDRSLLAAMRQKALLRVTENFTWEAKADRSLSIYKKVLSSHLVR